MKKILLFCTVLIFTACSDDFPMRENLEGTPGVGLTAETPPEGLKLKSVSSMYSPRFFYHPNGFVDSIHGYSGFSTLYEISKKFIYNDLNQIVESREYSEYPDYPESAEKVIIYYEYNRKNQIVSQNRYDEENKLISNTNYSYNSDGSLIHPYKIVVDENLVEENYSNSHIKYQFDSTRNPYYNIYPKAYRIIKHINKNNIIITENYYSFDTIINHHTLKYNTDNYVIEEHISNLPLDVQEYTSFSYY